MTKRGLIIVVAIICAGLFAWKAMAADSRRRDGGYATQRAFGEFDRSTGWCDDATTTSTNVWASANVPAEISSTAAGLENRRAIRQIVVQHMDATNDDVAMCARLGPNTGATPTRSTLTCVGTAGAEQTNGTMLGARFAGVKYVNQEIRTTDSPTLFVLASTGTVRYCVTAFWKS